MTTTDTTGAEMEQQFNELTPAEHERLAWLLEELGEAQQAIGKILRHGYESRNPVTGGDTNRRALTRELGDVLAAVNLLADSGDVIRGCIDARANEKSKSVLQWMHHQPEAHTGAEK